MKTCEEAQTLSTLAQTAATLLSINHAEAHDAAMPILAMIKAQFPEESAVEAQDGERVCGQTEANDIAAPTSAKTQACQQPEGANGQAEPAIYDPLAESVEKLRAARAELDQAEIKQNKLQDESWNAELAVERAKGNAKRALEDLKSAIDASNRA